ncbi:mitochondrial dicarboxylate carrier-like [Sphaerodactylus townsendi]|uniref:mitochondrial dicarboxylate carrier-like n=1 Tax=Sphaerodactylus townsendi TaxID=933632 RepID=UPI002026A9F9|nr:mitochondrial dicarboxylate carrier-like [Sphaerodactylus townsendi]
MRGHLAGTFLGGKKILLCFDLAKIELVFGLFKKPYTLRQEKRVSRWYFGGLASCRAACCTHPLDLLKVHLQTQQEVKLRMTGMALHVIRNDGFLALYSGLSASLCQQMTYSLTCFAIYETVRDRLVQGAQGPMPFYQKVLLAAIGGFTDGFVGTPADLVNVRMQNDMKLPLHLRHNYSHALKGLYRVLHEEGVKKLFSGATSSRGPATVVPDGGPARLLFQPVEAD